MAPSSAFPACDPGRTLLGVAVPSASLPAHTRVAPTTHAAIGSRRSDPIVTLSNGDALDLHATVDDAYTDGQLVSDTLHSPVGMSVTSEVDTSVLGPHDTVHFYTDAPSSTCSADTGAAMPAPQIPVTAPDRVSADGTLVSTAGASGQSP